MAPKRVMNWFFQSLKVARTFCCSREIQNGDPIAQSFALIDHRAVDHNRVQGGTILSFNLVQRAATGHWPGATHTDQQAGVLAPAMLPSAGRQRLEHRESPLHQFLEGCGSRVNRPGLR